MPSEITQEQRGTVHELIIALTEASKRGEYTQLLSSLTPRRITALRIVLSAYDEQKRILDGIHDALGEARESDDVSLPGVVAQILADVRKLDARAEEQKRLAEAGAKAEQFVRMLAAKDTHPGTDDYDEMVGSPEFWTTEYAHAMNQLGAVMEVYERAHAAEKLAEERGREIERLNLQIECDLRDPAHENCRNGEAQIEAAHDATIRGLRAAEAKVAELERERLVLLDQRRSAEQATKFANDAWDKHRTLLESEQSAHEQARRELEHLKANNRYQAGYAAGERDAQAREAKLREALDGVNAALSRNIPWDEKVLAIVGVMDRAALAETGGSEAQAKLERCRVRVWDNGDMTNCDQALPCSIHPALPEIEVCEHCGSAHLPGEQEPSVCHGAGGSEAQAPAPAAPEPESHSGQHGEVRKGDEFGWTTIGGSRHYGRVCDIDSNVIYVKCQYHGKECCTEMCEPADEKGGGGVLVRREREASRG